MISTVRPGVIDVYEGDRVVDRVFVAGGFAEVTEAYFDRNDMEPFDLKELQAKDPTVVPVLEKVWGVR